MTLWLNKVQVKKYKEKKDNRNGWIWFIKELEQTQLRNKFILLNISVSYVKFHFS